MNCTNNELEFLAKRRGWKSAEGLVPELAEQAVLLRRRAGKLQREIAAEIGCSRGWLNMMERGKGSPIRLLEYWKLV